MAEEVSDALPDAESLLGFKAPGSVGTVDPAAARVLLNIADGATVNATDAQLRDRATHTGTQAQSTITGLEADLAAKVASVFGRTPTVVAEVGDYTADQITETGTNKILTASERTKLAGVATAATANSTDAELRDRTTHSGSQATSTITGLDTALALLAPFASPTFTGTVAVPEPTAGDDSTKPATTSWTLDRLASFSGGLEFLGPWNANTNTPTLSNASGIANPGGFYIVSVTGTTAIDGISSWAVGDWIVSDQTAWRKIPQTDAVSTVFGRTGAIVATAGDYTADQITETGSNKILTSAERTKLAGIATAATANATDASLRDRTTHTGTQLKSTITGLQAELDSKTTSVFGRTGVVIAQASDYTADQIAETAGNKIMTSAERTKLSGIQTSADVTNAAAMAAAIVGVAAKNTPIDADTLPLIDSAAGSALKELTWANTKATLKTYFDTLYDVIGAGGGGAGGADLNSNSNVGTPGTTLSSTEAQILSVAITPSTSTAKILVAASVYLTKDSGTTVRLGTVRLRRGTTNGSPQVGGDMRARSQATATTIYGPLTLVYIDSPASTSAQTYTVRGLVASGNSTATEAHIIAIELTGLAISALTADATPDATADYLATYDTSATSHKKVLLDNLRFSMANAATGFVLRTLKAKFAELVSVKDFGAVGDGSTNDTAAVQAAFTAAAGTNTKVLIPHGNYLCSALDASNVRRIECEGIIKSTITSGQTGIIIGTIGNANTDMVNGDININIWHSTSSNSGLTGTVGVLIKGMAHCRVRGLRVQWFETGVDIAPDQAVGTQYVAFNTFDYIGTYGTLNGIRFNGNFISANGWINENTFSNITIASAGNSIAGTHTGIYFGGTYPSNNNLFLKAHLENLARPIYFLNALANEFILARLETAGAIVFGDGTDDYKCSRNRVSSIYTQSGTLPTYTFDAWAPNIVCGPDGPVWREMISINMDDFLTNGSTSSCSKVPNNAGAGGNTFASMVFSSTNRTFQFAGSDRGSFFLKVSKGDILRLTATWFNSVTTGTIVTLVAADAAKANLGTLGAGAMAYIGTSQDSNYANSTSGTSGSKDITGTTYPMSRLISINRSEVVYLRFDLRTSAEYIAFKVEKLSTSISGEDYTDRILQPVKMLVDFTTAPEFIGQTGVQGTSGEIRIAKSTAAWGTNPLTSTTAALAAIGNAINTTDKFQGKTVYNTTTKKLVTADGSTAVSSWVDATGTAVHLPV